MNRALTPLVLLSLAACGGDDASTLTVPAGSLEALSGSWVLDAVTLSDSCPPGAPAMPAAEARIEVSETRIVFETDGAHVAYDRDGDAVSQRRYLDLEDCYVDATASWRFHAIGNDQLSATYVMRARCLQSCQAMPSHSCSTVASVFGARQ